MQRIGTPVRVLGRAQQYLGGSLLSHRYIWYRVLEKEVFKTSTSLPETPQLQWHGNIFRRLDINQVIMVVGINAEAVLGKLDGPTISPEANIGERWISGKLKKRKK